MLPQGATSWSLQLTAGADTWPIRARSIRRRAVRWCWPTLRLDSHEDRAGRRWTGVRAQRSRLPRGEPVDPDWVSDCDLFAGLCVTDPSASSAPGRKPAPTCSARKWARRCRRNWSSSATRSRASATSRSCRSATSRRPSCWRPCSAWCAPAPATWARRRPAICAWTRPMASIRRARHRRRCAAPTAAIRMRSRAAGIFDPAEGAERASLLGPQQDDYSAANGAYRAWYPERGGNVDIVVGGSVSGDAWTEFAPPNRPQTPSASVGNWLWRQGPTPCRPHGGSTSAPMPCPWPPICGPAAIRTSSASPASARWAAATSASPRAATPASRGARPGRHGAPEPRSRAPVAAVGGTGRVAPDGSLVLTGGGDLRLRLGGALNGPGRPQYATQYRTNRQKPTWTAW